MENHSFTPTWETMDQSPPLESVTPKYKIKLKYGGYFRLAKNSSTRRYCFGYQKCIYVDTCIYNFEDLVEEATKHYPRHKGLVLTICFIDKYATEQSFVKVDSHEKFHLMLTMYDMEKELTVYVTTDNNSIGPINRSAQDEDVGEPFYDEQSEYSLSDGSYHSRYSTDNEVEVQDDEDEIFSSHNKGAILKVGSTFDNVTEFRRVLINYALTNEFEYFLEKSEPTRVTARCTQLECKWRIHASLMQDGVTFAVKTFVEMHSCTRSNKGGNKLACQGWIASVVKDKLKSDGDASATELRKWIMKSYNVDVSYMKVWRGKEQAHNDIYGNWEDSFMRMDDFKEELLKRNPGSIIDIDFETKGNTKRFLRFFISLVACSKGFLAGCRPYIALDACHLKGKFNGVLVAATSVDGNDSIFPVAYGVLESENKNSWIWFLELLKKAIGVPNGLVISSDMQKGLEVAVAQVYPDVEHRECIRHLYSNFKKHFRGKFFTEKLWRAARTFNVTEHEKVLSEIGKGVPCFHAAAFIAFTRDANWDNYVDAYFTTEKLKLAYALEVSPMPAKDQWVHKDTEEKIHPPTIKRPPGRPRKNRIKSYEENQTSTGKRHRCPRCGGYGHHEKTCKNPASQDSQQPSTSKAGRRNTTN